MKYSDLLEYVLPEVSGCPHFTAERAIRDACIELCEKTDVYMTGLEPFQIVAGVTDYDLDAPAGTEPNRVMALIRQGVPLTKVRPLDAVAQIDGGTRSQPSFYTQLDNTNILVGPVPDANETLKIMLSLKPNARSTSVPDTVGLENRDVIVSGALWRLQMMSTQGWYDPNAAQMNLRLFNKGVTKVMRQVKYGFSGAPLTVRYREFL